MANNEVALKVIDVEKDFKLPKEHSNEIKQVVINWIKGIKGYRKQEVLKGINFEVKKGDFFGIVGRNGSGKSTLLKIISGIYQPNKGRVDVNGTLIPFIELGVGFNPELTGMENVYLNGAMLGFSKKQISEMYDEIVDFAELHDFMDQKLKNYSSGMQVRLAFSVAIKARGDILVLDEVLAVGDEAFQKKCNDYFMEAKKNGKTIILVTHSMDSVRQFCNKAIFINNGKIEAEGEPNLIANEYSNLFRREYIKKLKANTGKSEEELKLSINSGVELLGIKSFNNINNKWVENKIINFRSKFRLKIKLKSKKSWPSINTAVEIIDKNGKITSRFTTSYLEDNSYKKGINNIIFDIENVLSAGEYSINIRTHTIKDDIELLCIDRVFSFVVNGPDDKKFSNLSYSNPDYTAKNN